MQGLPKSWPVRIAGLLGRLDQRVHLVDRPMRTNFAPPSALFGSLTAAWAAWKRLIVVRTVEAATPTRRAISRLGTPPFVHASFGRQRGHDGGASEARSRRLYLPALAVGALAIDNERLTA